MAAVEGGRRQSVVRQLWRCEALTVSTLYYCLVCNAKAQVRASQFCRRRRGYISSASNPTLSLQNGASYVDMCLQHVSDRACYQ
jgi:hypothetical protein